MNKFVIVAAAAIASLSFGAAAIAQDSSATTGDFDKVDANNDLAVSWDEALGAYPTLSQTLFDQADANKDGNLDESEFDALRGLAAGLDDSGTTSSSSSSAM